MGDANSHIFEAKEERRQGPLDSTRAVELKVRMPVRFEDIEAAAARIEGHVIESPCPLSIPLSELTGARIFCKLDYLQRTGSFKERGARNALALLSEERRKSGVIAASAGNHALGLAYHGQLLGIPVTVV